MRPIQHIAILGLLITMSMPFSLFAQVTASFQSNSPVICFKPYQAYFQETSTSSAGTIVAWHWDFGDGDTSIVRYANHIYQAPGSYDITLIATDDQGNKDTLVRPSYIIVNTPINITSQITPVTCNNNGAIDITVTGGALPYDYTWWPGPNNAHSEDTSNLLSREYWVGVTDANGCNAGGTFFVADYTPITFTTLIAGATCLGDVNGSITINNVTGGLPPYEYSLDNTVYGSSNTFAGLVSSGYRVYVKDANGCIVSDSVNVNTSIAPITYYTDSNSCHWAPGGWNPPIDGAIHIQKNQIADPLKFSIDGVTFVTDTVLSPLDAGTYTLHVLDSVSGCITTQEVYVGYHDIIQLNIATTLPTCNSCNDGEVNLTVTGGTAQYTYMWSNGSTAQDMTRLSVGTYRVTVTDANGCYAEDTAYLYDQCPMQLSFPYPTLSCYGGVVELAPTVSGGLPPYTYVWHDGSTDSIITIIDNTQCYVTVTDASGCAKSSTIYVEIYPPPPINIVRVYFDEWICPDDTAVLTFAGNNVIGTTWSPNYFVSDTNGISIQAFPDQTTLYTGQVRYQSGCIIPMDVEVIIDTACVWPGDANYDGVVDNNDILSIGIGYGSLAGSRIDTGTVWKATAAQDALQIQANGANYKHMNTNGWWYINADDTLAVSLNYSLTHLKTEQTNRAANPNLFVDLPDTLFAGQTVVAPIYLGQDTAPIQNVYGVKFSITYDNTIVDTNTVSISFNNSWMGTLGTDLLGFSKDLYALGKIDAALTRTNQVSVNGGGPIGLLSFTMKDDVSGKDFLAIPLNIEILSERGIDELENDIALTTGAKTVIVLQDTTTGIPQYQTQQVKVYPNPTNGLLHITTSTSMKVIKVTLVNVLGQSIEPSLLSSSGTGFDIDLTLLARGIYVLNIITPEGILAQRILLN